MFIICVSALFQRLASSNRQKLQCKYICLYTIKYLRVSSIWLEFAPAHDDSCFAKLKILPTFISELLQIKLLGAEKLVLDYVPLAAPLSCVRFEALITTDPTAPIFDLAFTRITLFNPLVIVLVKPGAILAL